VTLDLLHQEYLQQHPDGYRYTQFCEHYREWLGHQRLSMRQIHAAGEKLFVDYSGKKPKVVDPRTGEVREVELFVAVLGASNYTYAEASETQRGIDFIGSHVRAFNHFGGVTRALVPDQLKSGVTQACRYEPGIQRTYEEMARHYGAAVVPARPGRPRDKAKVEGAVLLVQRWILARLRHETFFSLNALNERIFDLLDDLNDRTMRLYGQSRRQLFEQLDKPALRPLPVEAFVYAEWKTVRMNIDYHVEVDHHFYSASHVLAREQLLARSTATTVELFHKGERVASHLRSFYRGRHTTVAEHMPKAHQKHLEWTPSRIIHWAQTIGLQTKLLVERILCERPHPEMGYRTCLGILRLAKRYGNERLESASARAVRVGALSYRSVDSILKNGLDRLPAPEAEPIAGNPVAHENVRGGDYYH
jgi:transposase